MRPISLALGAFLALFVLSTALGSFYQIDEGERGVIITNGKVTGTVGAGLHWKMPFITAVETISLRDGVLAFDNLEAYTSDKQTATITRVSVNYRIVPAAAAEIYTRYGSSEAVVEQLLTRRVGKALEETFGHYNADSAVRDRTKLGADFASLIKVVDGPIEVISVQIENFSFSDEYESNIAKRMAEEVKVDRLKQEALQAEQLAKIAVTNAQAKADSQVATATANATAVRLQGDAEADAIRAKAAALRDNAGLIELTKAERWNGVLPTTMLPNTAVPFLTK